jgi:hypothetical protein
VVGEPSFDGSFRVLDIGKKTQYARNLDDITVSTASCIGFPKLLRDASFLPLALYAKSRPQILDCRSTLRSRFNAIRISSQPTLGTPSQCCSQSCSWQKRKGCHIKRWSTTPRCTLSQAVILRHTNMFGVGGMSGSRCEKDAGEGGSDIVQWIR